MEYTFDMIHSDGKTVLVKGKIESCVFKGEYELNGEIHKVEFETQHDLVPMLGFDNVVLGDICRVCNKKF